MWGVEGDGLDFLDKHRYQYDVRLSRGRASTVEFSSDIQEKYQNAMLRNSNKVEEKQLDLFGDPSEVGYTL